MKNFYLYLYKIARKKNEIINFFYSFYWKNIFGVKDIKIEYPVRIIDGICDIEMGENFISHSGLRIETFKTPNGAQPYLKIGKNVTANYNLHIGCINRITIEDDVLIGSNVLITDHTHGLVYDFELPPAERGLYSKGEVVVEQSVWLGENVSVLPGVRIGHHSIVGANSVVTKSCPPYSVIAGSPAVIIKKINSKG